MTGKPQPLMPRFEAQYTQAGQAEGAMNAGLTPEQLAHRRGFVCGSDAAEVMSGEWNRLWKIKMGLEEEGDLYDRLSGKLDYFVLKHFTRERLDLTRLLGHVTEDLNAFWYEKQTGRAVTRRREWTNEHPRYTWMGANLDGVSTTSRGYPCYWDAKWTGRLDDAFIARHTPQGVHCATILGFDHWGLSVLVGNGKWEWVEQECDPLYQAELIAATKEFWSFVERGEEPEDRAPPGLPPKPQPRLRSIVIPTDDPAVFEALSRSNNWLSAWCTEATRFAGTQAAATVNNIAKAHMKDLVPEDVGTVEWGLIKQARDKAGSVRINLRKGEDDDAG